MVMVMVMVTIVMVMWSVVVWYDVMWCGGDDGDDGDKIGCQGGTWWLWCDGDSGAGDAMVISGDKNDGLMVTMVISCDGDSRTVMHYIKWLKPFVQHSQYCHFLGWVSRVLFGHVAFHKWSYPHQLKTPWKIFTLALGLHFYPVTQGNGMSNVWKKVVYSQCHCKGYQTSGYFGLQWSSLTLLLACILIFFLWSR